MKSAAIALVALALGCSPLTKSTTAGAASSGEDRWTTVSTAFRLTPKDGEEEKSIRAAIYAGARQYKMDCQEDTDQRRPVCTNLVEILRRGMPRGNMELYVEHEAGALHVFLVGDGRGPTCGAIQHLRARLTEAVAAERIRIEAKDPCKSRF